MFRTLQSRLLLSYLAVILTALCLVGMTLFFFATRADVRNFPTFQRLAIIGSSNSNELIRLQEAGTNADELAHLLRRTAVTNNIRILIADALTQQVIYDSNTEQNWEGQTIADIERPRRILLNTPQNSVFGLYHHTDGSNWLVYGLPFATNDRFGRFIIFYTQREPTPLSFFREFFLRPLLGAGVVALLLSVLLSFGIAGSVARPLRQVAGAAEAIAQGDYDQQLPMVGPEEVQRVAASFNSMTAQVKATQHAQRDFVANVSHDLKTPLTAVSGWSQALLDGTAVSPQEQQQAAGIIYQEAERMQRMVNQLLDLARLESGQLELARQPLDLGELLRDVHQNLSRRAQDQNIHLTLDAQPVPPISGDYDRLMQVFTNLVDNALTHTSEGGRVHLAVKQHSDKAVEALVQDTGVGIPAEDLPRIFERFYQVDKSRAQGNGRRGTGLGLAIVRELVEAHQGIIQAYSQVGKGSAFAIRLPISDKPEKSTIVRRQP